MVCAKCEEDIELDIALEEARRRMEAQRGNQAKYARQYNLRLEELYYGPLREQLNENTPLLKLGTNEDTKDLFKPQPIKRNRFWKR